MEQFAEHIGATAWENLILFVYKQLWRKSDCAYAQSDLRLCCSLLRLEDR